MTIEERIAVLQKELDDLKEQVKNGNGVFERVETGASYYTVKFEQGKAEEICTHEEYDCFDDARFDNNNYFLTKKRANEVAQKINTLLLMERIHDMLCPEYEPDWNECVNVKYSIYEDAIRHMIIKRPVYEMKSPATTYFPEDKIDKAIELYKSMT